MGPVLSVDEASELLGVLPSHLIRLLDANEIPSEQALSGQIRTVQRSDVVAFAEGRERRREGRRRIVTAITDAGLPY